MRLQGKVAFITGGTRGIGRMTAILMAKEGAQVAFTGRHADTGREVEDRIREAGGVGMFIAADNMDEPGLTAAVHQAAEAYGPITVLMNNAIAADEAGSGRDTHVHEIETATIEKIMRGALLGAIWASKAAIPYMRKAGVGSIINVSASSSVGAIPARPAYQASKGALNALTRQMAYDYGKDRIRTNTIVVGFINTGSLAHKAMLAKSEIRAAFEDLVLTPYLGESSDIAYGAIYLASDEAKYVNGAMLTIDGGATCHQKQPQLDFAELLGARD